MTARTGDGERSARLAGDLLRLHTDPELLVMVNVWDVASARVVAGLPGCRALATASYSIAASAGYPDGEAIPLDEMISVVGRIADAVELPVSADLEAGYGDPAIAVRRAIAVGAVGANLEDQMRPLAEAVNAVDAAVAAADAEGGGFVLNARTDAFLRAADRDLEDVTADAIARGLAFLDAGASCVFVPGRLDEATIARLVEAFGAGKLSVLAGPGSLPQVRLAQLGVARISFGPWTQRLALAALADAGADLLAGSSLPEVRAVS
jgi:2-methylisocitrate lyase-like PEP mutase family enzyme